MDVSRQEKSMGSEVDVRFLLQTCGLVFRGFDFVNPLDLESGALVMIHNCVLGLARRGHNKFGPLSCVEYVVMGHAKLVLRGVLELF